MNRFVQLSIVYFIYPDEYQCAHEGRLYFRVQAARMFFCLIMLLHGVIPRDHYGIRGVGDKIDTYTHTITYIRIYIKMYVYVKRCTFL